MTAPACGVLFGATMHAQPVVAAGMVITPLDAEPPVPTFTGVALLALSTTPLTTVGALFVNRMLSY